MGILAREAKVTKHDSGGEEFEEYRALNDFILPWIGAPVWLPPTDWGPIFISAFFATRVHPFDYAQDRREHRVFIILYKTYVPYK